jgi:type IV pilus assembly protein PilX
MSVRAVRPVAHRQRGFSLIVVLLLLTIMIGLGTTALRTTAMDARIAGDDRDRQLAFEAAEAALRDAEGWLRTAPPPTAFFSAACSHGLCLPSTTGTPQWRQLDWSSASTIRYGRGGSSFPQAGLSRAPRYIIEVLPAIDDGTPYRVTAAGWGRNPATDVRLQAVFLAGGAAPPRRLSWRQER